MEKNLLSFSVQIAYIYTGKIERARTQAQMVDVDFLQCHIPRMGLHRGWALPQSLPKHSLRLTTSSDATMLS